VLEDDEKDVREGTNQDTLGIRTYVYRLESGDTKTLQYINGIQARGAEQLMGISAMSEWELTHERAHTRTY
jgi:hypothetical protein